MGVVTPVNLSKTYLRSSQQCACQKIESKRARGQRVGTKCNKTATTKTPLWRDFTHLTWPKYFSGYGQATAYQKAMNQRLRLTGFTVQSLPTKSYTS